jgi:1-deoxy-D-xylulose-5-phosphate reductoisomerase
MRVPIAYGLSWPERMVSGASPLDFKTLPAMTFEAMDAKGHAQRFPGLSLAWQTLRAPSGTCAVLNAANEIAVEAFLNKQIRFDQIHVVNQATLASVTLKAPECLDDLLEIDRIAREAAKGSVGRCSGH